MIAVLFARADSVYKTLPDVEVWDKTRDATQYLGAGPVIAHPPCAQWGKLKHFAHLDDAQMALAWFALSAVRRCGGVLEHPHGSNLWDNRGPTRDEYGGWTLPIQQKCFGHLARKTSKLYVIGCAPKDIPALPLNLAEATRAIGRSKRKHAPHLPEMGHAMRERTPLALALWLIELARRCHAP